MLTARSLLLAVLVACTAQVAHAVDLAFVAKDVSTKLTLLFDGTWAYTVNKDGTNVATLFGRVKDVTALSIEKNFRELVEATERIHHLNFEEDFDHDVASRKLGAVRQFVLQQVIDTRRVENAYLLVNFNSAAKTLEIVDQTVPRTLPLAATRTPADAQRIVLQELCNDLGLQLGNADDSGIRPCSLPESVTISVKERAADPQLLSLFGTVHVVYHFDASAKQKIGPIWRSVVLREYDVSAVTGPIENAIVRKIDRVYHSTHGYGRVFSPDPLMIRGRSKINPENVKNKDRAYVWKRLPDLDGPVNGHYTLKGTYAAIVNIEDPQVPDTKPTSTRKGVPRFAFSRTDTNEFASVMAYFHVATLQRQTAFLGFPERRQRPLPIDILVGPEKDNLPAITKWAEFVDGGSSSVGEGHMEFGRFQPTIDSIVSDAEDGEAIAHEYGHALLLYDAHGRFGTEIVGALNANEPKIISEGFADFWAMATFAATARHSRHDPRCFAEWDGGSNECYRRIGMLHTTEEIGSGTDVYKASQLWSGVLADIFEMVFHNRRVPAERLILQGHLNAMNRGWVPTMSAAAQGILKADGDEYGGRHKDALCEIFDDHHIAVSCCSPYGCLLASPP
ncbi:MAG TPA: hypothetical protein VLC46_01730 [Thermoanaerobaculia bacterium]|jgi:hypothetical protein|nr:hypothetical protein [Thermoanaerobaculia bacterium]